MHVSVWYALNDAVHFVNGTVRFVYDTIRFLHGTLYALPKISAQLVRFIDKEGVAWTFWYFRYSFV